MKKLIYYFLPIFLFGNSGLAIYQTYVKQLEQYSVKLPKDIYNPFLKPKVVKVTKVDGNTTKKVSNTKQFVEHKLLLLAVLNKQVLLKIDGLDVQKWMKKGDKIDNYQLLKIINSNSVLVKRIDNNKKQVVNIQQNDIKIKVAK